MKQIIDEEEILSKRWPNTQTSKKALLDYVKPIISNVAKNGDSAIRDYTMEFDRVSLDSFRVSQEEIQSAYNRISKKEVEALIESRNRVELIESQRLALNNYVLEIEGTIINCTLKSIQSVGCYVPGGKAVYPSSVIMNVTPAKVAGVKRVVVCTPPSFSGDVNPLTLIACDICLVDEVYKVGGIQAIAALAYGTETIPRVNKIVGPGNQYVNAAKMLVSNIVSIDKIAGPSEIIVIADEYADPRLISIDLISQAEHGVGGITGLVTTSERIACEVINLVEEFVMNCNRSEIVSQVLDEGSFIYIVPNLDKAVEFVNRFAPEHLEIMTKTPEEIADRIYNSGLMLLGNYTPVASTDYCMGVNHVLPTGGYAKISSGITILDYMKPVNIVKASKTGLDSVRDKIMLLSRAEGLLNHNEAVEARFR